MHQGEFVTEIYEGEKHLVKYEVSRVLLDWGVREEELEITSVHPHGVHPAPENDISGELPDQTLLYLQELAEKDYFG